MAAPEAAIVKSYEKVTLIVDVFCQTFHDLACGCLQDHPFPQARRTRAKDRNRISGWLEPVAQV